MLPEMCQIEVKQQHGGMLCGFHCLYNATCFIEAVLGETRLEVGTALTNMMSSSGFHRST